MNNYSPSTLLKIIGALGVFLIIASFVVAGSLDEPGATDEKGTTFEQYSGNYLRATHDEMDYISSQNDKIRSELKILKPRVAQLEKEEADNKEAWNKLNPVSTSVGLYLER